jgi:hypothetical protein
MEFSIYKNLDDYMLILQHTIHFMVLHYLREGLDTTRNPRTWVRIPF